MDLGYLKSKESGFIAGMILCTAFMGSSFPSGKYLISEEAMPAFYAGGWRFLLAGGLILAFCAAKDGLGAILPASGGSVIKGALFVLVVGCLQTAGTMGFLNLALTTLSASMASLLLFTNPLWVAILAHFALGETLSWHKVVALVCGILGVSLCLGGGADHGLGGIVIALAGSLCWALCTLISKKHKFDKSVFVFTGWQLTLGALVMLAISKLSGEAYDIDRITGWGIACFIWLVGPASIGSFGLWFTALSRRGATVTSSYLFLVPLFSAVFSMMVLGEAVSPHSLIGGAIIIVALWLINLPQTVSAVWRERLGL
ncbi:DMT family transporter [Rhodospirillum rubrum]|uniref:EamA domain-containing protein n=1 Tax=Rhodospirillum rubrum (strain ATCC 11170 / ATH 1.1.1 / DSM 467 / LMG 4362 / NCIMB 8255 / S1) TaxID=269796 RepID=Q2RP78_RHORT|nr:DMT family transporter [Rhodospirillum rubrum]ABC24067.1 Protein of unknown function DUF6, transmembrane [Rhodospirillum rubrum ATCC 11170]AEO49813.1 hypothetical protein F11_16765 [Rhodospirillum rubrum F11]MBK5955752.1 EamA family transporter [Rhodospirillum rubrum]QXG80010.1 DMT family transporter [Rhodospirillum rubrum]HCF17084.1 EamA/RhaT family transporter [Rhodospirillum rubrum]